MLSQKFGKYMMFRRQSIIVPFLLAASLTALTSCGTSTAADEKNTQTKDNRDTTTAAVTETETESPYQLTLPKGLDYAGREIVVCGWEHYEDIEFFAEAMNGEVVNDAVYQRNLNVQENLNVKLSFLEKGGRAGDNTWMNQIKNANKAGDAAFDIIAGHSQNIGNLAKSQDVINLLDCQYLDFMQPWWRKELLECAVIRDNLYFVTGDICPSSVARSQGIFFNTSLLQMFDLEDPYTLVVEGSWTFDKMAEMTKGVYLDINADGKKDEGDRFGFSVDGVQLQAAALTAGIISVEPDKDGYLTVAADYLTDRTTSVLDAWIHFMHNNDDTIIIKTTDDTLTFRDGRALFYAFPLGIISSELRDCEFNIGFVPWPKADAQQKDYVVCTSNAYSLWSIPIAAADPDMSAAVMENLGYEGFLHIMPAMFETAYKVKYNNTESQLQSQVFDILRENLVFDIGRIMNSVAGDIFNLFPNAVIQGKNTIASNYEKVEKKVNKALSKWMEDIENAE